MKTIAIITLSLIGINTFSQSKKDQILVLSNKVDSLSLIVENTQNKNRTLEDNNRELEYKSSQQIELLNNNVQQLTDSLRLYKSLNSTVTLELNSQAKELLECMTLKKEMELQSTWRENEMRNLLKTIALKDDSIRDLRNQLMAAYEQKNTLIIRFEEEVINKAAQNQDERFGDETEACLHVFFNDLKADRFCDFGLATLSNDELPVGASLISEFAEKIYITEIVDNSNVKIHKTKWTDGMEESVWTKSYKKLDSGKWIMNGCTGNCK